MDTTAVRMIFRIIGGILVILASGGAGMAIYMHQINCWQQLHTLARLLEYLRGMLSYQALTGAELVRRAALYPEFAGFFKNQCDALEQLTLPDALSPEQKMEIQSGLAQVAWDPRQNACSSLKRLADLCEEAAAQKKQDAQIAKTLWPRLGLCVGILMVVLLC